MNSELRTIYISSVWSFHNQLFTMHNSGYYLVSLIFGTTIPTSFNILVKCFYRNCNEEGQDWDTDMLCTNKGMLMYHSICLCPNAIPILHFKFLIYHYRLYDSQRRRRRSGRSGFGRTTFCLAKPRPLYSVCEKV